MKKENLGKAVQISNDISELRHWKNTPEATIQISSKHFGDRVLDSAENRDEFKSNDIIKQLRVIEQVATNNFKFSIDVAIADLEKQLESL